MDFIFMLTRDDMTIEDCLEVFETVKDSGITHLGFKDVGAPRSTLMELNRRIKAAGMICYMEVVSTTEEACLNSAKVALEIGVDRLLGGTAVEKILDILEGSSVGYYPFPGIPVGHPTDLGGTPDLVEDQCRNFQQMGCPGVDLLAYRATEADPIELTKAARRGHDGYIICAGSVDSPERIRALADVGADAFTIGSAVFNGSFSPRKGHILSQIKDVLAACKSLA
jgi:putative N-acetylmannosamine-6-phosphate epimerase